MPNKVKETIKINDAEQIRAEVKETNFHDAYEALHKVLRELDNQHKTGTIDYFDNYTAEEYLQLKSDVRGLMNISSLIFDILEEYEETYF